MNPPPSSYAMLVSYADGQLDRSDRERVLTLMNMDAELNREVWELHKLKDMVELSYQALPQHMQTHVPQRRGMGWPWLLCGLVLLILYILA